MAPEDERALNRELQASFDKAADLPTWALPRLQIGHSEGVSSAAYSMTTSR